MYNQYATVQRMLHVIKDIYNLVRKPLKRERILHNVQSILEQQIAKNTRHNWDASAEQFPGKQYGQVCYGSIEITYEQDGTNLTSLTGDHLLISG
jgi:hypothetical protein